jgi:gliding motility-associated-like protein
MNKKKVLLNLFLLISILVVAQSKKIVAQPNACGADNLIQILRKNPVFSANEAKMNAQIRLYNASLQSASTINRTTTNAKKSGIDKITSISPITGIISIPVVVHIIRTNPESVTDQMVIDGIKELNDAFAHQGSYSVDTLGVNTGIQFCLAKTAPDGSLTNGIDRVNTYYENIDVDLESGVLATLTQWDPAFYANIWLVSAIKGEIPPTIFECGSWQRVGYGGYASAGGGLVVSSLSGPLVAHEMGHYLSLLHTFQGQNCANADCTLDGDLVCDTPPDKSTKSSPCASPENSCNTDTISGPFTKDMPDNISNLMDYGSPCPTVFTQGQSNRMHAFLNVFNGGSLLNSNRCNSPCNGAIMAKFDWYSNSHPIVGDMVNFNNTSTGASKYEWYVNGVLLATTQAFSYQVATAGTYVIKLLAFNATRTCVSSYSGNVMADCGVMARFSPDKRIVASASVIYKDPVLFQNTSYGATNYQWFVSDKTGANFSNVGLSKDLLYDFLQPGTYKIKLVASKGACVSNSGTYTLTVLDPKPDGSISIYDVKCYKNDSIRVVFGIINNGYDTIHAGAIISFYDKFPGLPNTQKLNNSFVLPTDILGKCSSSTFTQIIGVSKPKQDSLTLVFDENNLVDELNEANNTAFIQKFQFKIIATPIDTTVYTNSTLSLLVQKKSVDPFLSVSWSPVTGLSCTNCVNPILSVTDTVLMKVTANSGFNCTDSAIAYIKVFPIDLSLDSSGIDCFKNDILLVTVKVCLTNGYTRLNKKVEIEYFDNDIRLGAANKLGSVFLDPATVFTNGCVVVPAIIKMTQTPDVFVFINRSLIQFELQTANNVLQKKYIPFKLIAQPADYDAFRGEGFSVNIINQGDSYKNLLWTPSEALSCTNCISPVIITNINREYKIVGSNKFFCTDSTFVHIKTYYRSHLALPNVFTPNGDGVNDYFYVIAGKEVVSVNQFQIFNRWGERVFDIKNTKPNQYLGGWNGYYKNKIAENGTYVYYIIITLLNGTTEEVKGNITLFR